ncbi:hypothetical protein PILCRDRAFT_804541 [Piloderma croceum F 1598]|uniref:Uncharacterized protein n=1 Tax=Piloderma croceum (strain F 1598) TaxID=765440 RepID=A0A0C3EGY3_PILCF|nr:hypothetical protein PILCRDRAFT_804541 [Piloderma croceum F 1598]
MENLMNTRTIVSTTKKAQHCGRTVPHTSVTRKLIIVGALCVSQTLKQHWTDERGKFHWAIIAPGRDGLVGDVYPFQIKLDPTWQFSGRAVRLLSSGNFVGCVRLPAIYTSMETLSTRFKAASPTQDDTILPYTHTGQGWSCALWVMRELAKFEADGLVNLGLPTWSNAPTFYVRVCGRGVELQEQTGGTVVNGIRIIDL